MRADKALLPRSTAGMIETIWLQAGFPPHTRLFYCQVMITFPKSGRADVLQRAAQKEALERSHAAHAEAMREAKSEADDYQRGLADRARSKFLASKQGGGLVIHRALYGVLPLGSSGWRGSEFEIAPVGMAGAKDFIESDGSSLLDPAEAMPEPEPQSAREPGVRNGDSKETSAAGACDHVVCYDVTTALQLRVEEKARRGVGSKLRIETDTDFAEQQGFADPCMGVTKQLRIAYSWRGQQFLAVSRTVTCLCGVASITLFRVCVCPVQSWSRSDVT